MSEDSKLQTSNAQPALKEQAKALLERLIQTYPGAFSPFGERQISPLKLGIHKELTPVIAEWGYDKATLKYALGMYTRQLRYQIALLKSEHRVDLQGQPAGDISEANRQTAQEKVDFIQEKRRQTREAKKIDNPRRHLRNPKPAHAPKGVSEKALAALQRKFNNKTPS